MIYFSLKKNLHGTKFYIFAKFYKILQKIGFPNSLNNTKLGKSTNSYFVVKEPCFGYILVQICCNCMEGDIWVTVSMVTVKFECANYVQIFAYNLNNY